MSLQDIKPLSTTRPGSLAALMEAVAEVGKAAGLTDNPQPCHSILPVKTLYPGGAIVAAESISQPEDVRSDAEREQFERDEHNERIARNPAYRRACERRACETDPPEPLTLPLRELAAIAVGKVVSSGGFTLDENGKDAEGDLWAVSVKGKGKVCPGYPSIDQAHAYLRNTNLDGQWFGGWWDGVTNETHLDCTQLFGHKHTAILFAKENDQRAIYNVGTGESVSISAKAHKSYHYNCECFTFWDAGPEHCPNCRKLCRHN